MADETRHRRAPRFRELADFQIDPAAAALLPLDYCIEKGIAILGKVPSDPRSALTAGMIRADDRELLADLAARLGCPVEPVQLNAYEVRHAIARLYGIALPDEGGELLLLDAGREISFAPGQAPAAMLDDLLAVAVRRRATDIHVETYHADVDVRFRIDGVLRQMASPLSPDNVARVVSRLKVLCGMDLAERRRAQDGRIGALFREEAGQRRVEFRVSVVPGPYGQDAVLRVLDPRRFLLDLEALEMGPELLPRFTRLIRRPHGLLLSCGPTNSGKTTTLYASVQALRERGLKIVTAEDPVEYEFPKVNQKTVTPQMGFADYLRAFLRQNPDVILVGEIRDPDTAETAIRAATTGHLVLSTVHTVDAVGAVGRLRVLGVPDDYISEVLAGSLGQRLLRRLCADCKAEAAPAPDLVASYYAAPPAARFFRGAGCERCEGTGYRGLVGVYELLAPDERLSSAIAAGKPVDELRRLARERGFFPLVQDALRKAERGLTSLEEVARRIAPPASGG